VSSASGAGEEAVVANAMEAAGQDVEEEAADELGGIERDRLDPGCSGCLRDLPKSEVLARNMLGRNDPFVRFRFV
jgi:hypothetical protein